MQSNWIKQADGSPNRPDAFKTFQSFKRFQTLARTRTPTESPPLLEGDKERVARHHSTIPSFQYSISQITPFGLPFRRTSASLPEYLPAPARGSSQNGAA